MKMTKKYFVAYKLLNVQLIYMYKYYYVLYVFAYFIINFKYTLNFS